LRNNVLKTASWVIPALALALGGCSNARGVLAAVDDTVPGAGRVEMLVASTRGPSDPAEMFSGDRGAGLSFARMAISIPPDGDRKVGEVQWPRRVPGNPATDFVALRSEHVDRDRARAWVRSSVGKAGNRRVLVFIHGFNNRYEEAVFRFAQIVHDSKADVVPVLFTWPSRGSILAYGYDRESSTWSRNALESVLKGLADDPSVGEVSVLAHSMGNVVALEALRQMAIRDGRVAPKIRNVLLAAPDVDVDLAREAIKDMGPKRPAFTLLVSQDDRALAVSRRVWGDSARLGAIDPAQEPYRTDLANADMTVVNLTELKTGGDLNHSKFAESPEVVRLLGRQLADGRSLADSRSDLGDVIVKVATGASAAVGKAAGIVVSAPVAIVDPRSRDSFGEHVQELGRSIPGMPGNR